MSLVLPVNGNLHSDTLTYAGDTARWGSFPVSYLFCHFEPLQQSHKLLLEVWLLKQKKGRKKHHIKPNSKLTNIQAVAMATPEVQGQL